MKRESPLEKNPLKNALKENRLKVLFHGQLVGTLASVAGGKTAFAYSDEWLEDGFSVSPFSLPLKKQVFVPTKDYFGGLFGAFADSLPDGWGTLLLDRMLKKNHWNPAELSMLERLAIVGNSGMGALTYEPEVRFSFGQTVANLDELARQCAKLLSTKYAENLDELYRLGGTSGGARPKIMTEADGKLWIIKFPAYPDGKDAGKMEYDYALCAKKCGIVMPEVRLFPSRECAGYFGVERFDQVREYGGIRRFHVLTAAALLELDWRQPSLDYHSLMKLTKILTRDNREDVENMFRRMCFNVFAHNRDDHSKNFSYLYDDRLDIWRLSPAYDLTYSRTYFGEHTTTVDGNGSNPGRLELLSVGRAAGMKKSDCERIISEIESCTKELAGYYR